MTNAWAEKKLSRDDVLAILDSRGYKSIAALAAAAGYPSVYLFQKDYKDHIPAKGEKIRIRTKREPRVETGIPVSVEPVPLPESKPAPGVFQNLHVNAIAMRAVGFILGGAGLALNYRYNSTLGQEAIDAYTMAAIGLGIDLIAIILPQTFFALIEKRHATWLAAIVNFALSICCAIIWLGCFAQSLNTGINFSATHRGDARQVRADVRKQSVRLNEALEARKKTRADLERVRTSEIIESEIQIAEAQVPYQNWRSSNGCKDVTISLALCGDVRKLRAEKDGAISSAERRDQLDKLDKDISGTSAKIAVLPPVSSEDPGGDLWSPWARILIDKSGIFITASMPSLAGFLFAFARKVAR